MAENLSEKFNSSPKLSAEEISEHISLSSVSKNLYKLFTINRSALQYILSFCILLLACIAAFSSRLFAIIRFESIIHEFDPWFNYRATAYMVENGFYKFLNWFDETAWFPLGRIVGGTVFPGLMVTSGSIHYILNFLNIPVHIRDICVFLAPFFSGLTAISTYLFTKEIWTQGAGLLAACFIAIVPGYISRSVAGSYDNEGIAIFALMLTYFLWVSAWGGYVFIINLIPLHVFVLLLLGRFSLRLYIAYAPFYILALLLSMQVPFVGFQPLRTSEHMASIGVFLLLHAVALLRYLQGHPAWSHFRHLFLVGSIIAAIIVFLGVVTLTWLGIVAPWSGRFYSLWDTNYAKQHIPIITSVSEHQPTTWFSMFFDLHILAAVFPVGLWYCARKPSDDRIFGKKISLDCFMIVLVILYAISASYFAGVMVRLILTLTPIVCVLAAIAISNLFDAYLREEIGVTRSDSDNSDGNRMYDKAGKLQHMKREGIHTTEELGPNIRAAVLILTLVILLLFSMHCTWITSNAYSSPSIVLASYNNDGSRKILDDFREAYYWLAQNTIPGSRVMSWWDYGYQIAGMGRRTTLVDNNTWNNSHIALVGKAMASDENTAYKIMTQLDVDYVLVIFGGAIGYSGDDINKFLWMVRIAEGEHPRDIREADYFTSQGHFRIDSEGSPTLLNCLMYKLSYYDFARGHGDRHVPSGYDHTRNAVIGNPDFKLTYLEEAYTTEHWLVRIYRVRKIDEFNRPRIPYANRTIKAKGHYFISKKTAKRRRGSVKNRSNVIKGQRLQKQILI